MINTEIQKLAISKEGEEGRKTSGAKGGKKERDRNPEEKEKHRAIGFEEGKGDGIELTPRPNNQHQACI